MFLIQLLADCLHHFSVTALTMASDAIAPAFLALAGCKQQSINMIFDVKPIANVEAISVQRDGLPSSSFENDDWDEFFWELPGSVVVAAVGEHNW